MRPLKKSHLKVVFRRLISAPSSSPSKLQFDQLCGCWRVQCAADSVYVPVMCQVYSTMRRFRSSMCMNPASMCAQPLSMCFLCASHIKTHVRANINHLYKKGIPISRIPFSIVLINFYSIANGRTYKISKESLWSCWS